MPYEDKLTLAQLNAKRAHWELGIKQDPFKMPWYLNAGFIASDHTVQQPVNASGQMESKVVASDVNFTSDMVNTSFSDLSTPTTVQVTVTTGQTWEIQDILANFDADGNAADRDLSMEILKTIVSPASVTQFKSELVRTTAGQFGALWFPKNQGAGTYYVNDNGTLTASVNTDNPVPCILISGEIVQASVTNAEETDALEIRVQYRRVA